MPDNDEPSQDAAPEIEIAVDPLVDRLPEFEQWLPDAVLPYWQIVDQFPIVGALVIAAVFFLLALVTRGAVFRVLDRFAGVTTSNLDDHILQALRKPVFTTVLFFGLTLAVGAARLPVGSEIIVNLLASVIVASWMRAILRVSNATVRVLEENDGFSIVEARTVPLFDLTIKLGIILVGSYVLLIIWGVNPVGWLASAGIVGIAVGFAAKDTLANLFSGFFIVADAPYKIGDYVNLDSGERGKVSAIGLRSTRLLTRDDVEITIPNGVIANAKIVNESGGPFLKIRSRVSVGVAYGSDVDEVAEVLRSVGDAHNEVCAHPHPRVRLRDFGASSLDFDLMIWIEDPPDRGRITHELRMQIYKAFADRNIEIPYSKHDIFIKEMPRTGDDAEV